MIKIVDYENDCFGCDFCKGCGRDRELPVYHAECDGCGEFEVGVEPEIELIKYNRMHLCKECFLYEWLKTENTEKIQAKLLELDVVDEIASDFEKVRYE